MPEAAAPVAVATAARPAKSALKDIVANCEVRLVGEAHAHGFICLQEAWQDARLKRASPVRRAAGQAQRHHQRRFEDERRGQDQQPGRIRAAHARAPHMGPHEAAEVANRMMSAMPAAVAAPRERLAGMAQNTL